MVPAAPRAGSAGALTSGTRSDRKNVACGDELRSSL
jgi:hypothetical protein